MKSKLPLGVVVIILAASIGWTGCVHPIVAFATTTPPSTTAIHQEIDFKANPRRIYDALLDASQFRAFSGLASVIQREAGGTFTLFDGQIAGRNVELVLNKRIVQAWRASSWPEGVYSIVKFELTEEGTGTRLIMDHTGFPEGKKETLESGWNEHYWEPLKKYVDR
jgi:activator of HSP90 ATPase